MAEEARTHIPRHTDNDYTPEAAAERRAFVRAQTGAKLDHLARYSFDPSMLRGNIENFIGVAQVPIGLAGPLRVQGEHARGDFYVPMATTEGTLIASYNRGMRVLTESGGVKTTIVEEAMQRSPVFIFDDALEARTFGAWVREHFAPIKAAAEATTRTGRLQSIAQFAIGPLRHLRFNYTTGDAAGQNMTGKAGPNCSGRLRSQSKIGIASRGRLSRPRVSADDSQSGGRSSSAAAPQR